MGPFWSCVLIVLGIVVPVQCFAQEAKQPEPTAPSVQTPRPFTPMTQEERFQRYASGLVSYKSFIGSAAGAGMAHARTRPSEWGGGTEGYGRRLANVYGTRFVRSTIEYGTAAALHEDNRYFPSEKQGFWPRTKYAIGSAFLARHDDGRRSISISRFAGATGGAFISRTWQPPSVATPGDGAVSFGINMGSNMGFNIIREFWPDLKRRMKRN